MARSASDGVRWRSWKHGTEGWIGVDTWLLLYKMAMVFFALHCYSHAIFFCVAVADNCGVNQKLHIKAYRSMFEHTFARETHAVLGHEASRENVDLVVILSPRYFIVLLGKSKSDGFD